jgi:hypothetical protein
MSIKKFSLNSITSIQQKSISKVNLLGTVENPATSASQLYNSGLRTDGLYYISFEKFGVRQVYCDLNTAGGGWMHAGTFSDNNEANTDVAGHIWARPLNLSQDTGIWNNGVLYGSQSFTADFKGPAWVDYSMTQFLMKDQGNSLRNLFYTNSSQITSKTLSSWWSERSWLATGSDSSNSASGAGRVTVLDITNFGVSDPVLDSGNKSKMLFKFGESDGAQDSNKDRTMICYHRTNAADGVDGPAGIGTQSNLSGTTTQRDITPYAQLQDAPPSSITGGPYNYTIWVR